MWGYQQHFHCSIQDRAERVFQKLDPGFQVKTFLVGLAKSTEAPVHAVCLEPEDCGFSPSDFAGVRADITSFLQIDGEDNLMSTTEQGNLAIQNRRYSRAVESAFMKVLRPRYGQRDGEYFFSGLATVGDHDVGVVLSIAHKDGLRYYVMPKSHAEDRYRVPLSIVEAVADEFLRGCMRSLYVPDPTHVDMCACPRVEEILREAANRLMEIPNFAARSFGGLYVLFSSCNYIASLKYESSESFGSLIIAPKGHPNVETTIELVTPIPLQKHRGVRKLLEVATDDESIISDGEFVAGFGRVIGTYDQSRADLFLVRFVGHHKWDFSHGGHSLMRIRHEVPELPVSRLNRTEFESLFKILLPDTPARNVAKLFELAEAACKQRHGTVLVFSPHAKEESERLALQATRIVPKQANSRILKNITAIDGAVLIDTEGVCHAIGVILDGMAIQGGDTGRGARYNSTLRYVSSMGERGFACVAIIVSEDDTAEVVPRLPRQIERVILAEKEAELDQMLGDGFHFGKSFDLMTWLEKHRFYLSESVCEKANRFAIRHNDELMRERGMKFHRAEFKPDPRMSENFLV